VGEGPAKIAGQKKEGMKTGKEKFRKKSKGEKAEALRGSLDLEKNKRAPEVSIETWCGNPSKEGLRGEDARKGGGNLC